MIVRFLLLAAISNLSIAGLQEGIAAMNEGDYVKAREHFLPLAEAGDDKAMITIGLMYHQGQGVKKDYSQAMDWYIKAFKKGNGDAYSNVGVMYRDGLGVEKNKKMAYCLFLITHVCGLGTEATQYRAGNCLGKIVPEMSHEELVECFDYTLEYIEAYVVSKGTLKGIPDDYRPSAERLSLKDKPWWLEGELDFLKEKANENDSEKKTEKNDLALAEIADQVHVIEIKEVFSGLITRADSDNAYSGQIKSEAGLAKFEKAYEVVIADGKLDFEDQMLVFGITDDISTRAFQFLQQQKLHSFTLDYKDTGIEYKLKMPDEGKKYSYLQIFTVKRINDIPHVKVKNLVRNGQSTVYDK